MSKESLDSGGGEHENLRGWESSDKSYFVGNYFASISPILYIVFWGNHLFTPSPLLVPPAMDYRRRDLGRSENLEGGTW